MSRIRELREEATRPELLDSIKEMKIKIRDYGDRYDVVSPEELAQQIDADKTDSWDDLTAWRTTRQHLIRFLGQQNLDERVSRQSGLIREK